MNNRKKLKKELARLKMFRNRLPCLIDCSEVYGDGYFKQSDIDRVNADIEHLEKQIKLSDLPL